VRQAAECNDFLDAGSEWQRRLLRDNRDPSGGRRVVELAERPSVEPELAT
jgi:hypothetical protein